MSYALLSLLSLPVETREHREHIHLYKGALS